MEEKMMEAQKRRSMIEAGLLPRLLPPVFHCKYYWTAIASPIYPMTWRHRWKNAIQSHSPYKPRREAPLLRTTGGEWRVEDRRSKNEESE
ncbi:hypothetical protein SLE2022_405420 [Rubroshorea leprosula]